MVKRYWFKAKKYGWGWYPASVEGWLIILAYVIYIIFLAKKLETMLDISSSSALQYAIAFLFPTLILLMVCFWRGEKPGWHWGDKKK